MAPPPRVAACLKFNTSRAEAAARERTRQLMASNPYVIGAIAWFKERLAESIGQSVKRLEWSSSEMARTRWRLMREGLGELKGAEGVKTTYLGRHGIAAGSYEPEVHGYGAEIIEVILSVTGSAQEANLALKVSFTDGQDRPPEVVLEMVFPRPLTPPPPPPPADEVELERLSAAICAAPDDDEPRAQLADFWIARGEPRGEFVRAQLKGDEARAKKLLIRHGASWTDGLPIALSGRVYSRGFLIEACIDCGTEDWMKSVDSPAWRLLIALDLGAYPSTNSHVLMHAPLDRLRRLRRLSGEVLKTKTIELPRQVTQLHTCGGFYECPPQIEELEIEVDRFDDLWVFSRHRSPQLALLSVTAADTLEGDDLSTIAGLLTEPRPARVVLIGNRVGKKPVESWRLTVTAAGWEFSGDKRVLQAIRSAR